MSQLIALDICILCTEDSLTDVYKLNKLAFESWPQGFQFSQNHLPHITLLQMYCKASDLDNYHKNISPIIEQYIAKLSQNPIWSVTHYSTHIPFNEEISVMTIELKRHSIVQELHERIIYLSKDYALPLKALNNTPYDLKNAFWNSLANEQSKRWVLNYLNKATNKQFSPHLTLGFGNKKTVDKLDQKFIIPKRLEIQSIVSAQLGNFCTVSSNIYKTWKV